MALQWHINSVEKMQEVAHAILQHCSRKKKFAVSGSMGAGKTTLIKEFCNALQVTDIVNSPTFAIVHEYSGKVTVYHFDLYRIEKKQELDQIGFEEYIDSDAYIFIEWPEIIESYLHQEGFTFIHIATSKENNRIINLEA